MQQVIAKSQNSTAAMPAPPMLAVEATCAQFLRMCDLLAMGKGANIPEAALNKLGLWDMWEVACRQALIGVNQAGYYVDQKIGFPEACIQYFTKIGATQFSQENLSKADVVTALQSILKTVASIDSLKNARLAVESLKYTPEDPGVEKRYEADEKYRLTAASKGERILLPLIALIRPYLKDSKLCDGIVMHAKCVTEKCAPEDPKEIRDFLALIPTDIASLAKYLKP